MGPNLGGVLAEERVLGGVDVGPLDRAAVRQDIVEQARVLCLELLPDVRVGLLLVAEPWAATSF